jgi:threonine dehydratase
VGDETFRICREVVDEIIIVTNDEVCAAIRDVFDFVEGDCDLTVEAEAAAAPAGGLDIAALLAMRLGRAVAFVGSVAALAAMTLISVGIGAAFSKLPESLQSSVPVGELAGVALREAAEHSERELCIGSR